MIKTQLTRLLFLLAAFSNACIYSDTGVYRVDPEPDEPPVISVFTTLDSLSEPTVTDSLEVRYRVDIENGDFYLLEVYVSDQPVLQSDTVLGEFWIRTTDAEVPAMDTLSMWFYYSTNSNSLGDILGIEANILELDYPVDFKGGGLK